MIAPYFTSLEIAKATTMPVTLVDAKRHLRLDEITEDDDYVRTLIYAVSDMIERQYNVALITKTVTEYHSAFPMLSTDPLRLHIAPGVAVTSVHYTNEDGTLTEFASSKYTTGKGSRDMFLLPLPDYEWPTDVIQSPTAVKVVYTAGYGVEPSAVPASVRLAILNMIGKFDANREDAVSEKTTASDRLLSSFFHFNS